MRSSYSDPTANTAIANVDRERRWEEKQKKLLLDREYKRSLRELKKDTNRPCPAQKCKIE